MATIVIEAPIVEVLFVKCDAAADTNVSPLAVLIPNSIKAVPTVNRLKVTPPALASSNGFLPTRSRMAVATNMNMNLQNPTPTVAPSFPTLLLPPASPNTTGL